jgi:hypothetical protein
MCGTECGVWLRELAGGTDVYLFLLVFLDEALQKLRSSSGRICITAINKWMILEGETRTIAQPLWKFFSHFTHLLLVRPSGLEQVGHCRQSE